MLLLGGTVATLALAFLVVHLALSGDQLSLGSIGGRVGLVEVLGDISESESVVEQLERLGRDPSVHAVVIRLDSPGGGVAASQEIYEAVQKVRKEDKPVVASLAGVAASGAYYVACAADTIVANPGTLTGSIGVIMLTVNARGLLEKVGVEANAITSGPRKDMGSPFRTMTAEEKAIFQSVIDSFYQRFLSVVQEGRPQLSGDQIKKLADGRIYSGEQAKAAGLVDDIGYLDEAIERAKKNAGLTEARIVTYRRHGEYQNNIYSRVLSGGSGLSNLANMDLLSLVRGGSPQFMYLWMP